MLFRSQAMDTENLSLAAPLDGCDTALFIIKMFEKFLKSLEVEKNVNSASRSQGIFSSLSKPAITKADSLPVAIHNQATGGGTEKKTVEIERDKNLRPGWDTNFQNVPVPHKEMTHFSKLPCPLVGCADRHYNGSLRYCRRFIREMNCDERAVVVDKLRLCKACLNTHKGPCTFNLVCSAHAGDCPTKRHCSLICPYSNKDTKTAFNNTTVGDEEVIVDMNIEDYNLDETETETLSEEIQVDADIDIQDAGIFEETENIRLLDYILKWKENIENARRLETQEFRNKYN